MSNRNSIQPEREILTELHVILEMFRTVFAEDKQICKAIDENYEKILVADLRLVPVQYDTDILQYVKVVKLVLANINFKAIRDGLHKITPNYRDLGVIVNSYHGAEQVLDRFNMPRTDRLRATNILTKLRPLFACIDRVFCIPFRVMDTVVAISDNTYGDILA